MQAAKLCQYGQLSDQCSGHLQPDQHADCPDYPDGADQGK